LLKAHFYLNSKRSAEGCSNLTNSAQVNGSIALALRGGCAFSSIVANAQAAGAKVHEREGGESARESEVVKKEG
jgi:hypothetical protein